MNRPSQLLNITSSLLRGPRLDWRGGVYFLCHEGSIVYVGQSKRCGIRVQEHTLKTWDEVYFLECEQETRRKQLEAAFISKLHPPCNSVIHRGGKPVWKHDSSIGFYNPDRTLAELWEEAQ